MNNADFTKLGGLPVTQYTFDFLQKAYQQAFVGISKWTGDLVILYGVEPAGSLLTDGLMSINGELIFFTGGTATPYVDIFETPDGRLFEDGDTKDVYYTREAKSSVAPGFTLADFVRLPPMRDMLPYLNPVGAVTDYAGDVADIPEGWLLCDASLKLVADYPKLAAKLGTKFGGDGVVNFGLPSGGVVSVGYKAGDTDFGGIGQNGGAKTHTLTIAQMPTHGHRLQKTNNVGQTDPLDANSDVGIAGDSPKNGWVGSSTATSQWLEATGSGQEHNNLQPYQVFAKIIKY